MENIGDAFKSGDSEIAKRLRGMKREKVGPCLKCRREGYPDRIIMKQVFEDGTEVIEPCRCERDKEATKIQRRINADKYDKACLFRKKDKNKLFENFIVDVDKDGNEVESERKAKDSSIEYVKNFDKHLEEGNSILFQGSYGTGKTHLSLAIREQLYSRGYKVLFFRFPTYMEKIWDSINDEGTSSHSLTTMALEADLLIIDEIWADNNFEGRQLYNLIDGRDGMCTIYNTNYTSNDFLDPKKNKSDALAKSFSRMLEETEILKLDGKDKRRRKIRK